MCFSAFFETYDLVLEMLITFVFLLSCDFNKESTHFFFIHVDIAIGKHLMVQIPFIFGITMPSKARHVFSNN